MSSADTTARMVTEAERSVAQAASAYAALMLSGPAARSEDWAEIGSLIRHADLRLCLAREAHRQAQEWDAFVILARRALQGSS